MFAGMLIDCAIKATAVMLLVLLAVPMMRRASAASRHLVWMLALVALLLLPAAAWLLPQWKVLPGWAVIGESAVAPARAPTPIVERVESPPILNPLAPSASTELPTPPPQFPPVQHVAANPPIQPAPLPPPAAEPAPAKSAVSLSERLAWGYAAGAIIALLPLALAQLMLWRLQRLPTANIPILNELRQQLGIRRRVRILQARGEAMPMTWGPWHAYILLPASSAAWPEDRLRCVLLHELAHIKRLDALAFFIARIACAAYWFHPLAWFAAARLRAVSEQACDDMVLAAGTRSSTYADTLFSLARGPEALRLAHITRAAAIAMARPDKPSQLHRRVTAILDGRRNRRRVTLAALVAGIALLIGCITPLAMLRGQTQPAPRIPTTQAIDQPLNGTRIAKITVVGNARTPTQLILDQVKNQVGKPLSMGQLEWDVRYVAALNQFVTVRGDVKIVESNVDGTPRAVEVVFSVADREGPDPFLAALQGTRREAVEGKWSEPVEGLRLRLTAPMQIPAIRPGLIRPQPEVAAFTQEGGLTLTMELANGTGQPLDLSRISQVMQIEIQAPGNGERVVAGDRVPVPEAGGTLAPGQILRWPMALERQAGLRSWKAGNNLDVSVHLSVRGPGYDASKDQPWLTLATPPLLVQLQMALPVRLTPQEIPAQWTPHTILIYHEAGIFLGSNWLRVDGEGNALLMRSRFGRPDNEIPPGVYNAKLTAQQLETLAALLPKHDFDKVREGPPQTDMNLTTMTLNIGGKIAKSEHYHTAEAAEPALANLRQEMRKIMVAVVKTPQPATAPATRDGFAPAPESGIVPAEVNIPPLGALFQALRRLQPPPGWYNEVRTGLVTPNGLNSGSGFEISYCEGAQAGGGNRRLTVWVMVPDYAGTQRTVGPTGTPARELARWNGHRVFIQNPGDVQKDVAIWGQLEAQVAETLRAEQALPIEQRTADLLKTFLAPQENWHQLEVAARLAALADKSIIPTMVRSLSSDDRALRSNAGYVLAALGDDRGLPAILAELRDTTPRPTTMTRSDGRLAPELQTQHDRHFAITVLARLKDPRAVPDLIAALDDERLNYHAAYALGTTGDPRAIAPLKQKLASPDESLRFSTAHALTLLNDPAGLNALLDLLKHASWVMRRNAADSIPASRDPRITPALTALLKDQTSDVRLAAIWALGRHGDPAAAPAIAALTGDKATNESGTPKVIGDEAAFIAAQLQKNLAVINASSILTGFAPLPNVSYTLAPPNLYKPETPGPAERPTDLAWSMANEFVYRTALRTTHRLPAESATPRDGGHVIRFKALKDEKPLEIFVSPDHSFVKILAAAPAATQSLDVQNYEPSTATAKVENGVGVGITITDPNEPRHMDALTAALGQPPGWKVETRQGTVGPAALESMGIEFTLTPIAPQTRPVPPLKVWVVRPPFIMNVGNVRWEEEWKRVTPPPGIRAVARWNGRRVFIQNPGDTLPDNALWKDAEARILTALRATTDPATPWGEPNAGTSLRLRPHRSIWNAGPRELFASSMNTTAFAEKIPTLVLDLKSDAAPPIALRRMEYILEWDGKPYHPAVGAPFNFPPAIANVSGISLPLAQTWVDAATSKPLELTPGTHTARLHLTNLISNLVTIEILADAPATQPVPASQPAVAPRAVDFRMSPLLRDGSAYRDVLVEVLPDAPQTAPAASTR